jgi:tetratricopeptide (TPR) repeat protein
MQGKLPEAVAECKEALRLNPNDPWAHGGLGFALQEQRKLPEAVAEYREALRLNPNLPEVHAALGWVLGMQGKLPEAVAECQEALRLNPDYPLGHFSLGWVLQRQGKLPEAAAEYKEALRLQPDFPMARESLALLLYGQGKLPEALAESREALRLQPNSPQAHQTMGLVLGDQGKLAEAVAEFQEALRLQPDFPDAYCDLGFALRRQGKFAESLNAFRRGHELGSKAPSGAWLLPSGDWVRDAERLMELDKKLPSVLRGEARPKDGDEQAEFARLCTCKDLPLAAARFFVDAFAANPALAEDVQAGHRYDGACAAALAGCGKGKDAVKLDEKERVRWRKQALGWLRDDLALWSRRLAGSDEDRANAQDVLRHWRNDPDFTGLRDLDSLAKLPDAERDAWKKLWADVDALLKETPKK